MKLTRRLFARQAPIAAVAAPMVLPQTLHQTAGFPLQGMLGGADNPAPPTTPAGDWKVVDKAWTLFSKERESRQEHDFKRHGALNLLGGLDPDLFALRSIPVTQKARIQMERNHRRETESRIWNQTIRVKIAKQLGLPENW